jgi:hypothetical protein
MKEITLLLLSVLLIVPAYAQQQDLKITNLESGKEMIIKEGKRVRVKNNIGQEFSGRFVSKGKEAIVIDGMTIQLSNMEEGRRNSVLLSVFTRGFLIYGGAVVAGMGVLIGAFGNPAGFILIIPGAALIYAGIKTKGFNKRYRAEDNWIFELITMPQ